ncbi:hypothetical protein DFQ27_002364 [Actinomortierella ambigua]|uniref:Rab-GAP TBC domain-containing protein n=1 Tax=Actinomortierella ambigua TaxID=1343610 RepID=A0A9P6Q9Q5_9FUNG|nr:hypothetical protein DFQ26_002934 [Actinomortierella ambigua]KAG0262382.1 hypothetical protein DFQ27_002364 [Actinomortierella ambigua]
MAMVTPAPFVAPAQQHNGGSNQEYSQHHNHGSNGFYQAQSPQPLPQPLPRQRTLKTSKSVDGLSRQRSHTADSSMQPITRQLQHLFVDSSRTATPTLTQSQIDTYNQTAPPSQSHYHLQQPPSFSSSGSGSSSATGESHYQFQDNHPYAATNYSGHNDDNDVYGGNSRFTPSDRAGGGSIYQGLSVPTSQIASRSTPKLTLFNTPPLSQSTYKDSKETRSFGGLSSSHSDHGSGPRTKSKSSHLKPIPAPQNKENEDEEHVERDQYGFKKESQWLSHQDFVIFETSYVPVMERRRQKWAIFMNDSHGELPPRSAKLKRYIRKGIPPALRGDAWFVYSGAKDKCDANPGLYNRLVSQAKRQGQANEHAEVIERDLHRTFPENINFKSQVTNSAIDGSLQVNTENVVAIQALRRVLLAFSLHSPSIGYCQSLNYIAGMLLLFMEEEHAFWTLSVITQNFLPEGMYDVTMEGANIDQAVLMTLIMERLPHIWAKFSNGATHVELDEGAGLPTVTLVTSHWFLTMFINILPVESVLRVWDCFFYEGRKILFRMALTILKMHESEITKIDDPLEVFQVVQNIPKRLIDCHKLMETCFKRVGAFDLTTKDIDRRYNHFRTKRRLARAASTSSRGPKK